MKLAEYDGTEFGIHIAGAGEGWDQLLRLADGGSRVLLSVDRHGVVTLADDLTLDEAKDMLREMAANCVRMMREPSNAQA